MILTVGQCISFLTAHDEAVHGLCWIPNNSSNILISGDERGVLIAHDVRTRSPLWNYTIPFIGSSTDALKSHGICCLHKHVYTHKTVIAAGCTQGYLSVFEIENNTFKMTHECTRLLAKEDIRGCSVLPYTTIDTPLICTTSFDQSVNICSLQGKEIIHRIHNLQENTSNTNNNKKNAGTEGINKYHTDKILSCMIHTNTEDIITTGADGNVLLWSVHS